MYERMKQIIFVQPIPLTSVKERMFYCRELIAAGFSVRFWNLAPFVFPALRLADQIEPEYHVNVQSYEQLVALLETVDTTQTIFVADLDEGWLHRRLLLLFKRKKCTLWRMYVHTATGCNHFTLWQTFRYLLRKDKVRAVKYAVRGIQYKLLMYCHGVFGNPYSKFISSGSNSHIDLQINHYDWEQYKIDRLKAPLLNERYAVFIDQYFPLHPEYQWVRSSGPALVKHYQDAVCRLFDYIEKRDNVRILIAAHPQAEYAAGSFGGRMIIKYKTPGLVNHAESVIMHGSAAVGYTIMADKPILFITTDYYDSFSQSAEHLRELSRRLGLPLYNIDHVSLQNAVARKIAPELRENYLFTYLTNPVTMDRKTADILIQTFREA